MHTNFRINSGKGESIYLFIRGQIIDKVENLKKQPAPNISYGRLHEESDKWGYQYRSTPNNSNCGMLCSSILADPVFSVPGTVFENKSDINLTLSVPEGMPIGTVIRYTLDGAEPTELSPQYETPISINNNTIVRAKLFCEGYLSPRSVTHSYLLHGRDVTLPVISIVSDNDYFYDNNIGILVDGTYNSDMQNYKYNWRRPVNFEYFECNGKNSELNQLCEIRVGGNSTRIFPSKSLVLYANKRFGTKRLEYEFFPDQRPGVKNFKSIMLRNSGDDFPYLFMRDAIVQRSMAPYVGLDWQAWNPAIIYINGEYKGMLNIRERSNEDNVFTHYDGLEDIDMVENGYQLKEGDMDNFLKFNDFYHEDGHTIVEYDKWMDVGEYRDLMIMNLFYNNIDFPGNNVVMWRPRSETGRWRFIAKDADYTLGRNEVLPSYNIIEWLYTPGYDSRFNWGCNSEESTLLFRQLMKDSVFFNDYIDRSAIYMGDFLRDDVVCNLWDQMYNRIKYEYPYHRALFENRFEYRKEYKEEFVFARDWLSKRHKFYYQYLADFYHLGSPCPLIINTDLSAENIDIYLNGVKLQTGRFDGLYFAGRDVELSAISTRNIIEGWNVVIEDKDNNINDIFFPGETYTFKMPQCSTILITPVLEQMNSIKDVIDNNEWHYSITNSGIKIIGAERDVKVVLYDMNGVVLFNCLNGEGKSIPLAKNGIYYLRVGSVVKKILKH